MFQTMAPQIKRDPKGFTLLELLVTIFLVSMITLVLVVGLRITLNAWRKAKSEDKYIQLRTVIPILLKKQLESCVWNVPNIGVLPFTGTEHSLSFFTTYAPMGSSGKGLLRITYVYDEERKVLGLYQQVITMKGEISEEFNPVSEKWNGVLKPVSVIRDVMSFELEYTKAKEVDPYDSERWTKEWKTRGAKHPTAIKMSLGFRNGKKVEKSVWYFNVGIS